MADLTVVAHSLAEAYLYLMVSPCDSCGKGPLRGGTSTGVPSGDGGWVMRIPTTCGACQAASQHTFRLVARPDSTAGERAAAVVNPTDEPSHTIDVAQWVTLFGMITEAASRETNKTEARHMGIEAAQCLEEALKFYDDAESDLPPPEAFFIETSRERFKANPEQFSKRRLLDLRSKLPSMSVMRARLQAPRKKPWWRFGR